MYNIIKTKKFEKHYKKLSNTEKTAVDSTLIQLAKDPNYPSLRSKEIKSSSFLMECSVNMDIRIIWYYSGNNIIVSFDIGHHDILNKI